MTDLKVLLELVSALGTPILAFLAWRVYRIETNHLPHIQACLVKQSKSISRLQGRNEGVDAQAAIERKNRR